MKGGDEDEQLGPGDTHRNKGRSIQKQETHAGEGSEDSTKMDFGLSG